MMKCVVKQNKTSIKIGDKKEKKKRSRVNWVDSSTLIKQKQIQVLHRDTGGKHPTHLGI